MNSTRPFLALVGAFLLMPTGTAAAAPAAPPVDHARVVSEKPAPWTPHVLDGTVKDILLIGDTVVVAGKFNQVAEADGGRARDIRNLFAFEHGTGRLLRGFEPRVDGTVTSLAEGPEGTVIAGGEFQTVNGRPSRGLTRLSLRDGRAVPEFRAALDGGHATRIAGDGDNLYVGGTFSGVNGGGQAALARLDARTGKVDPGFAPRVSEPRRGALKVQDMALSPDGRRLVVNGTFTKVNGKDRYQIAMLDTAGGTPTAWSTRAYEPECDYSRIHTYMRQMAFAPDGSYFAVVTAGGPEVKPGLCKSVSRFENTDAPGMEPTWSNKTGGDSLYAVEVTSQAVYVGGHQRWMDNPEGALNPGPGSVAREGIAAVDPRTGKALEWNPGRTRGHGVEALHATSDGLYVGSDTDRLAGEYHARLGMFPLS
ncbi:MULTISPECIES: delta-60 repeat domain-containing protein [unclassified Nocardiopsis]|uniref:delta-60 repeat domain-containing protein n=1 Tax=unclassified Nocardiopsis TaxID=2649073 RepID=UPI0013568D05|nr:MULTISPECIES: delta-60 repeat domain-containing protein [unclassified Nocardiopsis]